MSDAIQNLCDLVCGPQHNRLLWLSFPRNDGPSAPTDGAIAFYEAKLGPWFKYLSLRTNNYLFHNKSLREQTALIFEEYGGLPDWDWCVAADETPMTDACQFSESDHNYLSRLWEAAGLLYAYAHRADRHELVQSDHSTNAAPIDGAGEIPYQRHGGSKEEDGIGDWSPTCQLMPVDNKLAPHIAS